MFGVYPEVERHPMAALTNLLAILICLALALNIFRG